MQANRNALDLFAAFHPSDGMALHDRYPKLLSAPLRIRRGIGATGVKDRGNVEAGILQSESGTIGVIVVRYDNRPPTDRNTEIYKIISHSRGEHDPGNIVARKRQWPLDRPGRCNDMAGADAPQAVPGSGVVRRVIA